MKKNKLLLCVFSFFYFYSFSQNMMSPEILLNLKRLSEPALSPDGKTILFVIETMSMTDNKGYKDIYAVPVVGGNPVQLTSEKGNEFSPQWSSVGKKFGYLSTETGTPQWFEMNADGSGKKQITNLEAGISSFSYVASTNIAVYTSDVKTGKDVHDRYTDVPKSEAKIIDNLFYRTWNEWDDFYSTHVFIAPFFNGEMNTAASIDIMAGEAFEAEGFDVSQDGKFIAYSSKKLNGKEFAESTNNEIYLYDVVNKTTTNISKGLPGYDLNPKFSKDCKKISWTSMPTNGCESDISNLMCFDLVSSKSEVWIKDLGESIGDYTWTSDNKAIYFICEKEGTEQIFSFDVATKKSKQISQGGQDYAGISVFQNDAITLKTTFSMPNEVVKVNLKTAAETQLTFTNKAVLDKINFGKVESNWIRTSDNKKLQTWVFYPPNFDAKKKYPTLLFCAGGPEVAITQSFSYRWNLQLMCSKGYLVVAPNRRGVPGFGKEWKEKISKDWGGQSINDYYSALDSISKRSYVDVTRIGAVGASYGGYSVYWLAGHNQNHKFKTFIAHCGLFNLESWYPMTDQTFFGTYELGGGYWKKPLPDSYTKFSPKDFVQNWDTPILVIHNERDFRVPVTEGMQAFGAAQLLNVKSRFLYFPDEGHWVLKPQNSLVWHREFYRWLEETLK